MVPTPSRSGEGRPTSKHVCAQLSRWQVVGRKMLKQSKKEVAQSGCRSTAGSRGRRLDGAAQPGTCSGSPRWAVRAAATARSWMSRGAALTRQSKERDRAGGPRWDQMAEGLGPLVETSLCLEAGPVWCHHQGQWWGHLGGSRKGCRPHSGPAEDPGLRDSVAAPRPGRIAYISPLCSALAHVEAGGCPALEWKPQNPCLAWAWGWVSACVCCVFMGNLKSLVLKISTKHHQLRLLSHMVPFLACNPYALTQGSTPEGLQPDLSVPAGRGAGAPKNMTVCLCLRRFSQHLSGAGCWCPSARNRPVLQTGEEGPVSG